LEILSGRERHPFQNGSGRLELARAIVAGDNPLTSRVIVNRIWMHHFGQPLVQTPSDFGLRSEPPTHPEVLDYLACELCHAGWSIKKLHRTILRSAAYRQGSVDRPACHAVDSGNRLLWRMHRRRLEFEPFRDSLLLAADQLDRTMGGKPVDLLSNSPPLRRSVYAFIDRQDLPDLLRTFDFASPDQSTPRRPQTTVPTQALFLMNSKFVVRQAQWLAARQEIQSTAIPQVRIEALYRLVLGRMPSDEELAEGIRFIRDAGLERTPETKLDPWEQLAQVLLVSNEFQFVD
jgi:hypothetical protein